MCIPFSLMYVSTYVPIFRSVFVNKIISVRAFQSGTTNFSHMSYMRVLIFAKVEKKTYNRKNPVAREMRK